MSATRRTGRHLRTTVATAVRCQRRRVPAILALALYVSLGASAAWSQICLPPLFADRPRLHDTDKNELLSLNILLRQHEVCWREPRSDDETRIFALGNSAIYGFPWAAESSAIGLINRRFDTQGIPAHVFNLGFVFTYQLKEAMILSEALPYEPDFIVYGVTLDDLGHLAPYPYAPVGMLFDANSRVVSRLASNPPPTLAEPFRLYRDAQAAEVRPRASWIELRQAGTFVRLAAHETAKSLRKKLFPEMKDSPPKTRKRNPNYDCPDVEQGFASKYAKWKEWSMLDYLAELREETGVQVLVVNWPVVHEPRGGCYNVRYPTAGFQDYVEWMDERTAELGLEYLDLHDLLTPREFVDSIHPTRRGQRKVAAKLGARIKTLLPGNDAR